MTCRRRRNAETHSSHDLRRAGRLAPVALALAATWTGPALAQNPEMVEMTCRNLSGMAEENGWRDLAGEIPDYVGGYDDPERQGAQDWRLEPICDGRFMWIYALFGDVAPFALQPTEDPAEFVDYNNNRWRFTRDDDGTVTLLEWIWESGETFALTPVE